MGADQAATPPAGETPPATNATAASRVKALQVLRAVQFAASSRLGGDLGGGADAGRLPAGERPGTGRLIVLVARPNAESAHGRAACRRHSAQGRILPSDQAREGPLALADTTRTGVDQELGDAILTGQLVDLRTGDPAADDPAHGAGWNSQRTVSAALLADLLTNTKGSPQPRALRLAGARVLDQLDLEAAELLCPLLLEDCWFASRSSWRRFRRRRCDCPAAISWPGRRPANHPRQPRTEWWVHRHRGGPPRGHSCSRRHHLPSVAGRAGPVRHVAKAVLREDSRGARLAKEHKDSPRRIDAAVAAVMAVHRAAELAGANQLSIYI